MQLIMFPSSLKRHLVVEFDITGTISGLDIYRLNTSSCSAENDHQNDP